MHFTDAGLGLGTAHIERPAAEVDVLPAKRERLANPQFRTLHSSTGRDACKHSSASAAVSVSVSTT